MHETQAGFRTLSETNEPKWLESTSANLSAFVCTLYLDLYSVSGLDMPCSLLDWFGVAKIGAYNHVSTRTS